MASNVGKILSNKKLTLGGTLTAGLTVYGAVSDYKQARIEGRGKISAGISSAGNAVMWDAIGMKGMLTLGAIKYAPQIATSGIIKVGEMSREMSRASRNVPFANSTFVDTQQAYTMRQAGMQLAQSSKYNLQQTMLGNEAAVMHRV